MPKSSNFSGYVGMDRKGRVVIGKPTREDQARGAKEGFDRDIEGMKTAYESYKRDGDPDSKEASRRIGKADEDAMDRVQKAGRESDSAARRESNRMGLKDGGRVKYSKAKKMADGDLVAPPDEPGYDEKAIQADNDKALKDAGLGGESKADKITKFLASSPSSKGTGFAAGLAGGLQTGAKMATAFKADGGAVNRKKYRK